MCAGLYGHPVFLCVLI